MTIQEFRKYMASGQPVGGGRGDDVDGSQRNELGRRTDALDCIGMVDMGFCRPQ